MFALIVGVAVWRHAPSQTRWIGIAHPACTIVAIVATANHLLVDAAGAAVIVVVATAAVRIVELVSTPPTG